MIKNMTQLLEAIVAKERELLKDERVVHAPTVGSMYENLTKSLMSDAVFKSEKIKIVSGFINLADGKDSPELDCIIVDGDTESIRYSDKHRCKIEDVVAVIQVKKTLYKSEIADATSNLTSVKNIDCSECEFPLDFLKQTFQRITRTKCPDDLTALPHQIGSIFNTLAECISQPACIAIGFEGYLDHDRFRQAIVDAFEGLIAENKASISSIPDLIMNQNFAATKLNGAPFYFPMQESWWPIYSTTQVSPILSLLEVLYTKLVLRGHLDNDVFGHDLQQEPSTLLLSCKYDEAKNGFLLKSYENKGIATQDRPIINWEPIELSTEQYCLVTLLCARESVSLADLDELQITESDIIYLKESGLIGDTTDPPNAVSLITTKCQTVILPDGRYIAAENNSGRLDHWIKHYITEREMAADPSDSSTSDSAE